MDFFLSKASAALKSVGSADLLSFGGVSVSWAPGLLCWLPAHGEAKMLRVYSLIVSLKDISVLFV